MADQSVRRSSRATKGQNKRLEDQLEEEQAAIEVSKVAKKSKSPQARKQKEQEDSEDGEVKCICGATTVDEDDERAMAECEKCLTWQHVECMFGKDDADIVPEKYMCNDCKEAAVGTGAISSAISSANERLSETASQDSKVSTDSSAGPESLGDDEEEKQSEKEEDSKPASHKVGSIPEVVRISDLHDKVRQSVASGLKLIFFKTAIPEALESGQFQLPDQTTAEGFAERLAVKIESAMYDKLANKPSAHGSGSKNKTKGKKQQEAAEVGQKYREKFRSLSFNLRDDKNPQLRLRIVKGELTPVEIVTLSTEHMLNPELQKLAETVRKESIRESVLKADDAPRLRKTHKGEEFVELDEQTEHENRKRLNESAGYADPQDKGSGASKTGSIKRRKQASDFWDASVNPQARDSSGESDDSPSNRDISDDENNANEYEREGTPSDSRASVNYDKGFALDDVATYSPMNSPGRFSDDGDGGHDDERSHGLSDDNDDDDDDELANIINGDNDDSTVAPNENEGAKTTKPEFQEVGIWMGNVSMTGITQFSGSAIHLQGSDNFDPYESWSEVFDVNSPITIDGRLDEKVAGNYLYNIKSSKAIVSFILKSNSAHDEGFKTIYDYYHSRKKVGVVKHRKPNVKDAYLIPLSSSEPVPAFLSLGQEAEEYVSRLQSKGESILICLFVITPLGAKASDARRRPEPSATSVPIPAPRKASVNTSPASNEARNAFNPASVLSSKDFEILKGVLANNSVAGGGSSVAQAPLPSNPQMLLDLLQQTQKNQ